MNGGLGNACTHIAIHETANTGYKANAQAHSNLQNRGNTREASWHYQVDDKEAIQSYYDGIKCWHVGKGNSKAIAIEICVNSDGDFNKAVENAVELTKILMKRHNIPANRVVQHNHFTGKNCPRTLRNGSKGVNWTDFIKMIDSNKPVIAPNSSKHISKPSKPIENNSSLVDWMKLNNMDSSFNNRSKLAAEKGIKSYKGTSSQNVKLLNLLSVKIKSSTISKLKVDGYFGTETIKALQLYYKTPVDGVISKPSTVIRKLQTTIGTKVDGYFGVNSAKALQRHFGTPIDGKISMPSIVIKKLQAALNKGKI